MPTKMPAEYTSKCSPVGPKPRRTDSAVPLGNAQSYNMRVKRAIKANDEAERERQCGYHNM